MKCIFDHHSDGKHIPILYENQEFEKIEEYIIKETDEFVEFIEWSYKTIPTILYGVFAE